MALIEGQTIIEYGLLVDFAELFETTNTFENGGREFLLVRNDAIDEVTITIDKVIEDISIQGYGELTKSTNAFILESDATCLLGTFPIAPYNEDDGIVTFTIADYESVFVAVLTLG